jgi:hypothetical protein
VEAKAGDTRTIQLDAPTPIYGSLDITSNVTAQIAIDGQNQSDATPVLVNRILIGRHEVTLQADGYRPYQQTVEITEGKMATVKATLQEVEKKATLKITANVPASVHIDGQAIAGETPLTVPNLPIGKTTVSFSKDGYKTLEKAVTLAAGYNEIYGDLQEKKEYKPMIFVEYVYSQTAPLGISLGYCKQWGGYLRYKGDVKFASALSDGSGNTIVTEADFSTINFDAKLYYRSAWTAGAMVCVYNRCYLYAGLGYGVYGAAYQVIGTTTYYCPDMQKGLEIEAGARIVLWNHYTLSVGYSTILSGNPQWFGDMNFGIGYSF